MTSNQPFKKRKLDNQNGYNPRIKTLFQDICSEGLMIVTSSKYDPRSDIPSAFIKIEQNLDDFDFIICPFPHFSNTGKVLKFKTCGTSVNIIEFKYIDANIFTSNRHIMRNGVDKYFDLTASLRKHSKTLLAIKIIAQELYNIDNGHSKILYLTHFNPIYGINSGIVVKLGDNDRNIINSAIYRNKKIILMHMSKRLYVLYALISIPEIKLLIYNIFLHLVLDDWNQYLPLNRICSDKLCMNLHDYSVFYYEGDRLNNQALCTAAQKDPFIMITFIEDIPQMHEKFNIHIN